MEARAGMMRSEGRRCRKVASPRVWAAGIAAAVVVGSAGVAGAGPEFDYVGVDKCGTCHKKELMGDQLATWRSGPHAVAFATLSNEQSLAIARERGIEGSPAEAAECLSCHATSHGLDPARVAYPVEAADGVQCESCHGPGRDYRKKKVMSDREEALRKGLWEAGKDAGICTACHNERSPTFDPKRYTLSDGSHAGFDFDQAKQRILHEIPAHVKGQYIELEKKAKEEERERRRRGL